MISSPLLPAESTIWKEQHSFLCKLPIHQTIPDWSRRVENAVKSFPEFGAVISNDHHFVYRHCVYVKFSQHHEVKLGYWRNLTYVFIDIEQSTLYIITSRLFDNTSVMRFLKKIVTETGDGRDTRKHHSTFPLATLSVKSSRVATLLKHKLYSQFDRNAAVLPTRQEFVSNNPNFFAIVALVVMYDEIRHRLNMSCGKIQIFVPIDLRHAIRNRDFVGNAHSYKKIEINPSEIFDGTCIHLADKLFKQFNLLVRKSMFDTQQIPLSVALTDHRANLSHSVFVEYLDATQTMCYKFRDITQRAKNTISIIKCGNHYEVTSY